MIDDLGPPLNGMTKKAALEWLEQLIASNVNSKTINERVRKLRKERTALGIERRETYAHDEDWPAIKALAEKLQRRRAKMAAKRAP